jgi:hypothetical protein
MACLIGLARSGRFGPADTIVFIHTGGLPALFAYANEILANPTLADEVPAPGRAARE